MTGRPASLPSFSQLPLNKDDPPYSAWGLYGKDDQLGFLNRQTDEIVAEAAKEIKTGVRVSMNWPLDAQSKVPFFGSPRIVNDDIWTFNTQSSSQSWGEKGIVGRGVLLDFHRWRLAHNIQAEIFQTNSIPLKYLKATAEYQGTDIKFGDILIIRVGYMPTFNKLSTDELIAFAKQTPPGLIGVERSEEMLEWIWENFSAVAGDHPAFESYPPPKDWSMHEVLLSGWGCPIGELFNLERLAEVCDNQKKWSFFVTSEVCNVPGGVASPPNILAIF
ncbi:hypothetical protein AJ80_06199 [Polytolypa hystricis UAMH7299]|uniref:Cyclase n=1 Tax=Polytolypa hystricis (strain UAMH7299) TaxID=1447883 RepID=A0A2B7XPI0_POLH7|nr:hypothetical protein AJ80_06199 [Polytolypa hystricis UAMH7299]